MSEEDAQAVLGGSLVGAESPERPPIPVWEYLSFAGSNAIAFAEIAEVRFPLVLFGGHEMVTSLSEMALVGRQRPDSSADTDSIVRASRYYEMLHRRDVLRWDARLRSHIEQVPAAEGRDAVLREWIALE